MNIAFLNGVEKKTRSVFFDIPIEVGLSLVSFPALVVGGLFVVVLLGANWLKAVGAHLDVSWLELVVDLEKLKLKKLPDTSRNFIISVFCIFFGKKIEISPGATVACSVVHMPITHDELFFVNTKAGMGLLFKVFKQSIGDGVVNSLSITNKSESPVTVLCSQQVRSLCLAETVKIPGKF